MSLKYFIDHLMGQNIIDQEAAMHQLKEKDPMFKKNQIYCAMYI
jgi:hypothetical protein